MFTRNLRIAILQKVFSKRIVTTVNYFEGFISLPIKNLTKTILGLCLQVSCGLPFLQKIFSKWIITIIVFYQT